MGGETPRNLTSTVSLVRAGDEQAGCELLGLIYDELRGVASRLMRKEQADHTLSPTAVVHEAVIRLLGHSALDGPADEATCSRRPRGPCGKC
jgi:hypothetical protein